jgi:hypothetical protein
MRLTIFEMDGTVGDAVRYLSYGMVGDTTLHIYLKYFAHELH